MPASDISSRSGKCRAKGNYVVGQELPPEGKLESTCPECGEEMVITRITPILFASEFEELTLLCQNCDFTKKLKINRI